ncbi:MAG: hypothetical protein KME32_15810 [Mojavia pulchra JT2-VF2]|jgi:hypothetical protein|uniref:Uncharacterized protein n=1 Tax=Mojavia pulchra JT2-VF2 TaxID=287848 RepID=A0A951PZV1_9NOST|nr:hypothetical protein [Mojavia pulchra JT2-VF2]
MNHFKFQSLAFYGIAIGSVIVLFKTVTFYGENNLKAPHEINGRYSLTLAENLPNCGKSNALILNLQQSGIYLNASLLPAKFYSESSTIYGENNFLSGILRNQHLSLSGKINRFILCNISYRQNASVDLAEIKMQSVNQGSFLGQLTISDKPQIIEFTATPQKAQEQSKKLDSH